MTVYVDNMMYPWRPPWLGGLTWRMNHLFADTDDELHLLAASIGLKRRWFECPPKASWPHYDVSAAYRLKAIEAGAQRVHWRHVPAMWEAIRLTRSPPAEVR